VKRDIMYTEQKRDAPFINQARVYNSLNLVTNYANLYVLRESYLDRKRDRQTDK